MTADEYLSEAKRLERQEGNHRKALRFYILASKLGNAEACFLASEIYDGKVWFSNGSIHSDNISLGDILSGRRVRIDQRKREYYLLRAAEVGYEPALNKLIALYNYDEKKSEYYKKLLADAKRTAKDATATSPEIPISSTISTSPIPSVPIKDPQIKLRRKLTEKYGAANMAQADLYAMKLYADLGFSVQSLILSELLEANGEKDKAHKSAEKHAQLSECHAAGKLTAENLSAYKDMTYQIFFLENQEFLSLPPDDIFAEAQRMIAGKLHHDVHTWKGRVSAEKIWAFTIHAADKGSTEAQFSAGIRFQKGISEKYFFEKYASGNFEEALNTPLRLMERSGYLSPFFSFSRAERYLGMADANGYFLAQMALLELYLKCPWEDRNQEKFKAVLQRLELHGSLLEQNQSSIGGEDYDTRIALADIYYAAKDFNKALFYYKIAYADKARPAWANSELSTDAYYSKTEIKITDLEAKLRSKVSPISNGVVSETDYNHELESLDSMVGMQDVKGKIKEFADVMKIRALRQKAGLPTTETSLHLVFSGNPGTGKTSVAKVIGNIYRSLGFLSRGHVVTVNRGKLAGRYIGESAIKTNEKIEEALDGVLFIDEVYSLVPDPNHPIDYAHEVIATLVEGMETYRDRLAVVIAGYKSKMPAFIGSNPGLPSRFSIEVDFPDYNAKELTQIFEKFSFDSRYLLEGPAIPELKEHFDLVHATRGENFGNARVVRNLFDAVVKRQSARILRQGLTDRESLRLIRLDDLGL